ncbi:MAG: hypothetical protein DRN25_07010 [Thermoplasmata archaeon]|nr:MAG: hypothetical protein DRN25_07010 [Thermoplasmata archaeon]
MTAELTVRKTIRFSKEQIEMIKIMAKAKGVSESEIVRWCVMVVFLLVAEDLDLDKIIRIRELLRG